MERSEIAILIPCFNEEKTISKIITEVNKYGVPIVINDKSTDKTLTIIKQAKEKLYILVIQKILDMKKVYN